MAAWDKDPRATRIGGSPVQISRLAVGISHNTVDGGNLARSEVPKLL